MKWARAILLVATICSGACAEPPAEDAGSESPQEIVERALGAGASLAPDRSPNALHGDFNGDRAPDLLALVAARTVGDDLPPGVRVVRPWPLAEGVTPSVPSRGAHVVLAVIHGAAGQGGAFILHDPNPISILDADAAGELFVARHEELSTFDEPDLASRARGDVLVLPTEAGEDTFVYWDGSTYRVWAPGAED